MKIKRRTGLSRDEQDLNCRARVMDTRDGHTEFVRNDGEKGIGYSLFWNVRGNVRAVSSS